MTSLKKKKKRFDFSPQNDHTHFYLEKTLSKNLKLTTENEAKVESESSSNPLHQNLQD